MVDDERRAEIEAVARALMKRWIDQANAERYIGGPHTSPMVEPEEYDIDDPPEGMEEQARLDAEAAIAVLYRLRDARGDDEARCPNCGGTKDEPRGSCPDPGHARSTQGEDHEAGIEAAARALQIHYRDRALAVDVAGAVVAAYLSRMSPSRDGTVAVEDVARLVEALRPFADIADRMQGHRGESPLWAVIDECRAARHALAEFSPASTGDQGTEDDRTNA